MVVNDFFRRHLANTQVLQVLSMKPGQRGVVANGLIIGPLDEEETFSEEDVALLEKLLAAKGSTVSSFPNENMFLIPKQ